MKTIVTKKSCGKELPFPKLMVYIGPGEDGKFIVLFTEKGKGTVVSEGVSNNRLGEYYEKWNTLFEDFTGSVCLENENDY